MKYRFSLSLCVSIKESVYGLLETAANAFFSLNIRAAMALDFTSDRRMILTAFRGKKEWKEGFSLRCSNMFIMEYFFYSLKG